MTKLSYWLFIALLTACVGVLGVTGCDDDDDDNDDNDAADADADGDADSDADADADSDTDVGPDGLGAVCNDEILCEGEADYCSRQPSQDGNCTYQDCEPGGCPTGYQCCDCTMFNDLPVLCVEDESVEAFIGNVCEGCE